jgi:hypothetical protein
VALLDFADISWEQLAFPTVVWAALAHFHDSRGKTDFATYSNPTGDLARTWPPRSQWDFKVDRAERCAQVSRGTEGKSRNGILPPAISLETVIWTGTQRRATLDRVVGTANIFDLLFVPALLGNHFEAFALDGEVSVVVVVIVPPTINKRFMNNRVYMPKGRLRAIPFKVFISESSIENGPRSCIVVVVAGIGRPKNEIGPVVDAFCFKCVVHFLGSCEAYRHD